METESIENDTAIRSDDDWMGLALELAVQGRGLVEPNPVVGCVLVRDGKEIACGFHREFGGKHAEIEALDACRKAGGDPAGATAFVTLEPCCHQGKTPPCADRLIKAKIARVVIAVADPYPQVDGGGIAKLKAAGIQVEIGNCQDLAQAINAAWFKRLATGRPWIIAKWAMTLDGKIATRTGDSQWISCEESRAIVHQIRGRVDAIMVGSQTACADDPMLTARPGGPRVATRVIVDSELKTDLDSKLVVTANDFPTLFVTGPDPDRVAMFQAAGCEVLRLDSSDHKIRLGMLLDELGRREMTNVLAEGGGGLLGGLMDCGQIDEVHAFVSSAMIGGRQALAPIGGDGMAQMSEALNLRSPSRSFVGNDVYISGHVQRFDKTSADIVR